MEAGADRSAAEAGETRPFSAGSIPTGITIEHAGEATRSCYGPVTLLLGGETQAAPRHTVWRQTGMKYLPLEHDGLAQGSPLSPILFGLAFLVVSSNFLPTRYSFQ